MGFEWLPGTINFYCNGVKVGTSSPEVFNPSALWLTAVAMPDNYKNADGTYDIDDTKMDSTGYFGSSEYEYFRYYNKKLKGVNLLGNGHFELNRQVTLASPRAFYSTGLVTPRITPFAHGGMCAIQMYPGSTTGQDLQYIAGGKYTFEGYFKTKVAIDARLAVYDKAGNELKSVSIPASENWTKVSLTDINVTDSAYAVVEVTSGELMADDLSFFCQEGVTGYESYRDTDYEKYTAYKSAKSSAVTFSATEKSDSGWLSSSITGMSNLYAYAYSLSSNSNYYKNIYANWEYTFTKDEPFDVEIYQITDENNIENQNYTVTLDGVTVAENVSVKTQDATRAGAWVKLCEVDAKKGQVLKVSMSLPAPSSVLKGECVRLTPVRLTGHDEKFLDSALVAQLSNPIYLYENVPYAFDSADTTLAPYKTGDEIYVPYQSIKSHITIPGVSDNAEYVTSTQITASGTYAITKSGSCIIIYDASFPPSETAVSSAVSNLSKITDTFLHVESDATYIGTGNVSYQEVYDITTPELVGGWGTSSLGYGSDSRYASGSATATWELSPNHTNRYSVQIYNIVHAGSEGGAAPSTVDAGVDLSVLGKTYTYSLNQYEGSQGWLDLGEFDLEKGETLYLKLYNAAGSGLLRANAVRLVPVFETATFTGTEDKAGQEYYDHTSAEKTGTWTEATEGFVSSSSTDASLKWNVTPSENNAYRIQIYSPKLSTDATTAAKAALKVNDEVHYFLLNQTSATAGWYDLGMFELTSSDNISVEITNFAGTKTLYAKAIRLANAFEKPAFVNDKTALYQEYYNHSVATKVGAWQESTGVYVGCITAPNGGDNSDASITWNLSPAKNTRYSVQVYVPKYTSSGAEDATVELKINGTASYYTVYQRADSAENTGNGWYSLGDFDLSTSDSISIAISNRTEKGWLRAKAVRLVPTPTAPEFVNNSSALVQQYYGPEDAEKVGTWAYSGGEYAGCVYAQHVAGNENASITWNAYPETENTYDIQIYIPRFTEIATSSAAIDLEINGKYVRYLIDERAESADATGTGWYTLGSYLFKPEDSVSVTMSNYAQEEWLRAKAIRIIPKNVQPAFVGNFNENGQELHTYSTATQTGTWKSSTAVLSSTTYYGGGDGASITWNPVPKTSQKYSIQVYMPHHTSGSTSNAYVTLTIDGVSHTFNGINQNSDPSDGTGWYDFGVFDLTPNSEITVTMGKNSGTYVRAKDMRLVPYPSAVSVTKSGSAVTVKSGTMSNYAKTVIFAEFDSDGVKQSTQIFENAPTLTITMENADNDYKIFFWKNLHSMIPVIAPIEK